MKNLKISAKLIVSFLVISIITAIVGVVGFVGMSTLANASNTMYEKQTVPLPVISDIIMNLDRLRGQTRDYILYYDNADEMETILNKTVGYKEDYAANVEAYAPTITNPDTQALFDEAQLIYDNEMIPLFEELISVAKTGNTEKALELLAEFKKSIQQ